MTITITNNVTYRYKIESDFRDIIHSQNILPDVVVRLFHVRLDPKFQDNFL